jgi:hypothetical protein
MAYRASLALEIQDDSTRLTVLVAGHEEMAAWLDQSPDDAAAAAISRRISPMLQRATELLDLAMKAEQ